MISIGRFSVFDNLNILSDFPCLFKRKNTVVIFTHPSSPNVKSTKDIKYIKEFDKMAPLQKIQVVKNILKIKNHVLLIGYNVMNFVIMLMLVSVYSIVDKNKYRNRYISHTICDNINTKCFDAKTSFGIDLIPIINLEFVIKSTNIINKFINMKNSKI